ncbi:type I-E CRISPR-associated protein Cas5/CasD [Micromonospora fiedleri]|uniref:Type I-E CRISPR-associated protein Cas5/CasD n=1 Tax=Micromonospora fiedleri TaxID=1157498 RepID=A0ABS1UV37_9ACTN|nr:type I-E CRISPR-associated protein Cas5/CasD [Micromonospora fiedleri]MBL6280234.1 type I-E CRISPR-associated protein Cas5/CasD [Micromonospora fiedleri]
MPISSLAFCLDAPLQSWGVRSRGNIRDTGREPSKSGIIGLLAAALGIPRDNTESLTALNQLRMGVRVDREGILERDYQVTQDIPTTTGRGHRNSVSHRYYLADAVFLVVLEGDENAGLDQIEAALRAPVWPLYLGRRAFPPARPLIAANPSNNALTGIGLTHNRLDTVLTTHPWLDDRDQVRNANLHLATRTPLRTVVDCPADAPDAEVRLDVPLSFQPNDRRYTARTVRTATVPLTDELITAKETPCT